MTSRILFGMAVAVLFLALCVQILASIWTASPIFDEPYHIVRSYVYLKTGDSALLERGGHPPLANMLSVSPLLLRSDIAIPAHQPGWPEVRSFKDLFGVADAFFWRVGNDAESLIHWARLPGMLLSAILAGLVFWWAKQRNGMVSGAFALLLYAFDPNILAHSSVVTTDLGATFFVFASVYCLWRFCQRPSWGRLILTGVVFGLAQAVKFSALFLAPIFVALLLIWAFRLRGFPLPFSLPGQQRLSKRRVLQRLYLVSGLCATMFVIGFIVLWGAYGFQTRPLLPHEASHPFLDRLIPGDNPRVQQVVYTLAEWAPLPAPAYFADLMWLQRYAQSGHPSFLMGHYGVTGWWFYFPVAFAIKTPVPVLVLMIATAYLSLRHRDESKEEYFLVVPMALFFAGSMFSSIDIGYRNILPVLPLAFVYVSKFAKQATVRPALDGTVRRAPDGTTRPTPDRSSRFRRDGTVRWTKLALALLCVWYVIGTVAVSPHYLAYFNELVGGPGKGYRYLVDSNLDWGQDLKNLKNYLDARSIRRVYLSYFGTADPSYYDIDYLSMPDQPPSPDASPTYYAISATSLQNVYAHEVASSHWLSQYQPLDKVGYSIFVYRLP